MWPTEHPGDYGHRQQRTPYNAEASPQQQQQAHHHHQQQPYSNQGYDGAWAMPAGQPSYILPGPPPQRMPRPPFQPQYRPAAGQQAAGSLGWGGQTLPDGNRFYGGRGGRGRGRGGNNSNVYRGRGRRGGGGRGPSLEESDAVIADIVAKIRALGPNTPVHQAASEGLSQLDSRSTAVLMKQLANSRMSKQAWELFQWIRQLDDAHPLRRLCDVYLYTAMISLCTSSKELQLAMDLSDEMKQRVVERNVHTFSALMNVCIKAGQNQLALEVYRDMLSSGVTPNLVTYNTLIDLYGKTGQWAEAMRILERMRSEGIEPVTRTYNTLMIACNTSNQWQEALQVYGQMMAAGHAPNTTTYNALISAYSKAGRLEKVMEVYQEMIQAGCERSVITYSSLISACEKAGQWALALQLFSQMHQEGCTPNTITYNSLITACAQGAQWERASEVFEQMGKQGCQPDVVTYTALVSAYERGGQWRRALQAFEAMRKQGCDPDHIIYTAIIDALWDTGVRAAQDKAVQLYRQAIQETYLRHPPTTDAEQIEASLGSLTNGVAIITFLCWLSDLRDQVMTDGAESLPAKVLVRFGKGRQREFGSGGMTREAVLAWLQMHRSPFKLSQDSSSNSSRVEAPGPALGEWLGTEGLQRALAPFCGPTSVKDAAYDFSEELAVEVQFNEGLQAVKHFEETHCLNVSAMGQSYIQARQELVVSLFKVGQALGLPEEVVHDAVLLMDRVMSTAIQIREDLYLMAMVTTLLIVVKQALPSTQLPSDETVSRITGIPSSSLRATEVTIRTALGQDTSSLSSIRSLKLYQLRLGYQATGDPEFDKAVLGDASTYVFHAISDPEFLNYRPSVTAGAMLYVDRLRRGQLPLWPSTLAIATGYSDNRTPELVAAINGAQRLIKQVQTAATACQ